MIKWFKSLFKKLEIELEIKKVCNYCKGLGFHTGIGGNSTYWCECKRIDGKFPAECYTIDVRWDTSCHTILRNIGVDGKSFYYKKDLPDPKTVFEPYIKVYLHDGSNIRDKRLYRKTHGYYDTYVEKIVYWECLDSFYDEKEYSDFLQIIRNERLKELGI
jgi:hypothetical protein